MLQIEDSGVLLKALQPQALFLFPHMQPDLLCISFVFCSFFFKFRNDIQLPEVLLHKDHMKRRHLTFHTDEESQPGIFALLP